MAEEDIQTAENVTADSAATQSPKTVDVPAVADDLPRPPSGRRSKVRPAGPPQERPQTPLKTAPESKPAEQSQTEAPAAQDAASESQAQAQLSQSGRPAGSRSRSRSRSTAARVQNSADAPANEAAAEASAPADVEAQQAGAEQAETPRAESQQQSSQTSAKSTRSRRRSSAPKIQTAADAAPSDSSEAAPVNVSSDASGNDVDAAIRAVEASAGGRGRGRTANRAAAQTLLGDVPVTESGDIDKESALQSLAAALAGASVEKPEDQGEQDADQPASGSEKPAKDKSQQAKSQQAKSQQGKSGQSKKKSAAQPKPASDGDGESDKSATDADETAAQAAPTEAASDVEKVDAEEQDSEAGETGDEDSDDTDDGDSGSESSSSSSRRRRRRGGRRRRRSGQGGADSQNGDSNGEADEAAEQSNDDEASADEAAAGNGAAETSETDGDTDADNDGNEDGSSSSNRRRRRRRRRTDSDDGTAVSVREPRTRSVADEVTGIEGSTRLEAKRQRRKEGRAAGRHRAPILTEAEFLARRESVDRKMVIRQFEDYSQLAVLEDGVLVEHYVDRFTSTSLIGNIYLGRVQNVLPSMEAVFIDIGRGRNAVLYAGEVNWDSFEVSPEHRKVEEVFKSGQTVLVQVSKDPVGAKGARLTGHVSIPGRYVVYSPDGHLSGISRKLPDVERHRLKGVLDQIVTDGAAVIVRTAAEGASEEDLTLDVERLKSQWDGVLRKSKQGGAPALLYSEPGLTIRTIRDLFTEDFKELVIAGNGSDSDVYDEVSDYVEHVAPNLAERLTKWNTDEQGDLFAKYRIDEQISKALERKVFLPSGGSLVIDRTEAMTVIDVNTGKFTGSGGNLEETVTKNNLEAAEEIVRQLRLRDIGGIIVVDFIDMVLPANRDLLLRRLVECLGRDRTRHQVSEVTSLGLVQMTRKKIGTGLAEAFTEECEACGGRGYVRHDHPVESQAAADGGERHGRNGNGGGGSRNNGRKSSAKSKGASANHSNANQPKASKASKPAGKSEVAEKASAIHEAATKDKADQEPKAEAQAPEQAAAEQQPLDLPINDQQSVEVPAVEPQAEPTPVAAGPDHEPKQGDAGEQEAAATSEQA